MLLMLKYDVMNEDLHNTQNIHCTQYTHIYMYVQLIILTIMETYLSPVSAYLMLMVHKYYYPGYWAICFSCETFSAP